MPAGLGLFGGIGLGPETSGGVAVNSLYWHPALSESLGVEINRFDLANITGRLAEPDDAAGVKAVGGEIIATADPVMLGYLLSGILDPYQTTVVASGALWTHNFRTGSATAWDDRFSAQPYTLRVHRDVGQMQTYAGCVLQTLEMTLGINDALKARSQWVGADFGLGSFAVSAVANNASQVLRFDQTSISINGAGIADIEAFGMTMTTAVEGVATLRPSAFNYKFKRGDFLGIRTRLVVGFEDISELNDFRLQNEAALVVSLASSSYSLRFDFPRLVYTTFQTGMGGRGRQTVEISGRARVHPGSGTALDVALVAPRGYFVLPPSFFSLTAT